MYDLDGALKGIDPQDLRDSVGDFRNPRTPDIERSCIVKWWTHLGLRNQFVVMLCAAEIERAKRAGEINRL